MTNNVITLPEAVLNGNSIKVRFRIGTDSYTGEFGWQIDNFTVGNAAEPMFSEAVVEDNQCVSANSPVVSAGADRVIISRDSLPINVELTGTAADADGDPLIISWMQSSGPAITLENADTLTPSFNADSPLQNTDYRFRLTANDGAQSSISFVTISINPNTAPTVTLLGGNVEEGSTFTLTATSNDAEGDDLTYQWTQTAGPTVSLSSTRVLTPSFTAPQVDGSSTLSFQLIANDGQFDSVPAAASIIVNEPSDDSSGSSGGGSISWYALFLILISRIKKVKR